MYACMQMKTLPRLVFSSGTTKSPGVVSHVCSDRRSPNKFSRINAYAAECTNISNACKQNINMNECL